MNDQGKVEHGTPELPQQMKHERMKRKAHVRAKLNSVNHKQTSDSQFIACVTLMLEEDWRQVQFSSRCYLCARKSPYVLFGLPNNFKSEPYTDSSEFSADENPNAEYMGISKFTRRDAIFAEAKQLPMCEERNGL